MSTNTQPRQPSGTPTGGQFTGKSNPESEIPLETDDDMGNRPQVCVDGCAVPSTKRDRCDRCGVVGWVSDWPGQGGIVPDTMGDPLCDSCADELDELERQLAKDDS